MYLKAMAGQFYFMPMTHYPETSIVSTVAMTKRPATAEEEEKALLSNADYWNRCNPNHKISVGHWREKLAEAKREGYISEVCSCGSVFLAFHHYTSCREEDCPMKDGQGSLLDRMAKSLEEENGESEDGEG